MSSIRVGMILNEPPLPNISAATRSFAAIFESIKQRESDKRTPSPVELARVFATSTDLDRDRAELMKNFPDFHQTVELHAPGTGSRWADKIKGLLMPLSYLSGKSLTESFRKSWLENNFDIAHIEHLWTTYALPRRIDPDRVLVSLLNFLKTDLDAARPALNVLRESSRNRIIYSETQLIQKYRHFRVLSEEMAKTLRQIHPNAEIHIVPLPINIHDYEFRPRLHPAERPVVTCIGSMFWPPSHAAAHRLLTRLWPEIKAAVPDSKLQIVGRDACKHFSDFAKPDEIEVIENVPDITPYFHQADAMVYAPSAGSGTKVKIQEAMLYGVPVITNQAGIEGLDAVHGEHAMTGETDEELIRSVVDVLTNSELASSLAKQGRLLIERKCGPESVTDSLISIYQQMQSRLQLKT
jgi:glycosyltransferase involved in cell wall biosynthesis